MTRSDVLRKLIGRMIIKGDIEVFLDCQENNGIKSITYKDVNKYSYYGVTSNTWEDAYNQMHSNLKEAGFIK
ncbi:MAG: hypothetical protein KDD29_00560 [Flavobacteriales bacterium]|nr:hypothetical protein [Flavobacteriales bacterium]MCB9335959.1 hypothetical protein [Flavobacteriales bacterium]